MSAEIGELQRRLANLFRVGRIAEVNRTTGRVKVAFQGVTTGWLPWMTGRAGAVRDWNPPSEGEQVVVCSPSGEIEAGFVMAGAINYDDNPAPDNRNHVYRIEIPANGSLEVKIDGMTMVINKDKLTINGSIEVTGDVKAGTISLRNHTHVHTASEPAPTGAPIP